MSTGPALGRARRCGRAEGYGVAVALCGVIVLSALVATGCRRVEIPASSTAPGSATEAATLLLPATDEPSLGDEPATSWQTDLDVLAVELPARHIDAFHAIEESEWMSAVASARERAPSWNDVSGPLEVARLVALIGDGATSVVGSPSLASYPVALRGFDDGLWIVAASPDHQDLVGARVIEIDGIDVEELVAAVRSFVSADAETARDVSATSLVTSPEVITATGLDRPSPGLFVVELDGQLIERSVQTGAADVVAVDGTDAVPLVESQPSAPYGVTEVADAGLIYLNYRSSQEATDLTMSDLAANIISTSDEKGYRRLVIDLRQTVGLDSASLVPLIDALDTHPLGGDVIVLIGPGTYGSAVGDAVELVDRLGAVLLGSPSTQSVSHYGEVAEFTLPNSGVTVSYPAAFFDRGEAGLLQPDVLVPTSGADFFAGIDAVLDVAMSLDPEALLDD